MDSRQRIVFLHSYGPRTGHNFVSEAVKVFSGHQVLIHQRSETRLARVLDRYIEFCDARIFHDSDREFMDALFVEGLRERILGHSESTLVMIKDTSFQGVEQLRQLFPNDIHILTIRDPYSVFLSAFKAMNIRGGVWKRSAKKLGIRLGIYPFYYSRRISRKIIGQIPDLDSFELIRYEDLVNRDAATIDSLSRLFDTDKDNKQILQELNSIGVINSSFYEEVGGDHIWDQKKVTRQFDPVGRKAFSSLTRLGIRLGTRPLRKKLKYID